MGVYLGQQRANEGPDGAGVGGRRVDLQPQRGSQTAVARTVAASPAPLLWLSSQHPKSRVLGLQTTGPPCSIPAGKPHQHHAVYQLRALCRHRHRQHATKRLPQQIDRPRGRVARHLGAAAASIQQVKEPQQLRSAWPASKRCGQAVHYDIREASYCRKHRRTTHLLTQVGLDQLHLVGKGGAVLDGGDKGLEVKAAQQGGELAAAAQKRRVQQFRGPHYVRAAPRMECILQLGRP